jgi:anti-sigma factor RsiW
MNSPEPERSEAELAALADGTLPESRRRELEARVADDAELASLLAEQERAVQLFQAAAAEVDAPAGLRARIEAQRARRRRVRPLALAGGLAVAVAVAAAVLLTLPSGPGAASVAEAATLTVLPATAPAPQPQAGQPKLLAKSVDGVPFPNFEGKFGWRATGTRTAEVHGRPTTVVYYRRGGKRIGYGIVAGKPLRVPDGATQVTRDGVPLQSFTQGDRSVVTWKRFGRTCVISGHNVPADTLLKLASWKAKGAVKF